MMEHISYSSEWVYLEHP